MILRQILIFLTTLTLCISSQAQVLKDSVTQDHRFRIGLDILKLFSAALKESGQDYKTRNKIEVVGAYKINPHFYFCLDGGYGKGTQSEYQGVLRYISQGFYVKPGFDINTLSRVNKGTPNFELLIGYRLGLSSFNENVKYVFTSKFWETEFVETEEQYKSTQHWHEVLFTFRSNFMRNKATGLSTGVTLRTRIKPNKSEHTQLFIPGYGGNNGMNFALNWDVSLLF